MALKNTMALTGNIATLFEDNEKQKPLFPVTKTKAITNDTGENLDNILDNILLKASYDASTFTLTLSV